MKRIVFVLITFLFLAGTSQAAIVGFEDFDGGAINLTQTSNVFNYGNGGGSGGDVFGRVSSSTGMPYDVADDSVADVSGGGVYTNDYRGIAGQYTSAFFAMNDMDAVNINNATWTFDISAAASISDISIDIAAFGDFEASSTDGFLIEAQIDGGGYTEIFKGRTDENASKTYRSFDDGDIFTEDDPLELYIDGIATGLFLDKSDPTTGAFDTYISYALAGESGSNLDIRVSWTGTPSGSEPMGFDNLTINAVPIPGAIWLLSSGLLATVGLRRKNR